MLKLILALVGLALAFPVGGLVAGVDRRLTARLQSRIGPPLLQPFYDVLKLIGKEQCVSNPWLIFSAYICLLSSAVALLIFFLQGDLLLLFFVMTVGAVFRVAGALSVNSPFGNVGAQRELLQMLAYEPLLILTFVGISVATGSFMIADIYALSVPLLPHLPFLFIALGYALTIKLVKSPFDIASCHHGHQEIVRGVLTDYSGPQLALLEMAHWLDVVLLLGLCSLFWHTSIIGCAILLVVTYGLEILVDNISARMTWQWMLKNAFGLALGLAIFNIVWLYIR
ncbi:MAG: complex I subunit 1 family protein [Bilophila sp.]